MIFRVDDLAQLVISEALECHYYRNNDIVRIVNIYYSDKGKQEAYEVFVLRSNRMLHWLPIPSQLRPAPPLVQLADALNEY